jgi:SAM-dependent methyltransferase
MLIQVPIQIDDAATFYTRVDAYLKTVDPGYEARDMAASFQQECETLPPILGEPDDRSALDLTCGTGAQALALASLGWQVTGLDLTPAYLAIARARAAQLSVSLRLEQHDARTPLPSGLVGQFDVSISCMALDNILEEDGLTQALANLYSALKPGGWCYIRLRHMDFILDEPTRYEFSWERPLPNGRLIRLEDWLPLDDGTLVNSYLFVLEDHTRAYPYETTVFSHRRRALRKVELLARLAQTGFVEVKLLPLEAPWYPYAVTMRR